MSNYEYITCAETAKLVREALKKDFPSIKFSVRSKTYSGGASIDVSWMDGPTENQVKETTGKFAGADFDGMQDLKTHHTSIHPHTKKHVHYGADFIFEKRGYSAAFIAPIQARICEQWGIDNPGVKAESEYLNAGPVENVRIDRAGEYLSTLVWREAQDISAVQARKLARAEGQAITLSRDGNTWILSGDTYPKRRELREAACTWDKARKAWIYTGDSLPQAVQAIVNGANEAAPVQVNQAAHLRQLADNMNKAIEDKMRDGLENTARRARLLEGRKSDGRRLKVMQATLYALADAWDKATIPDALKSVRTKAQIESLMSRVYPTSQWGKAERKSLAQAGIIGQEAYERASFALTEFVRTEAGEKSHAETIKQQEAELARSAIPGFFPTPGRIVNKMLKAADLAPSMRVLEPSAGKGDIADGVRDIQPSCLIEVVEINFDLRDHLTAKGYKLVGRDFAEFEAAHLYERVLMNPPFEKGQDIDHVRRAFEMLSEGGRLVAIMSAGAFFRSDKKATAFRAWLDDFNGESEDLGQAFQDGQRSTGVRCYMVVIDKPQKADPIPAVDYAVIALDGDNPSFPYTCSEGVPSDSTDWCAWPLWAVGDGSAYAEHAQRDSGAVQLLLTGAYMWQYMSDRYRDYPVPTSNLAQLQPKTVSDQAIQLSLF